MTVKQRLINFLKYKKIGQKRFAQSIGMSDGYVNAIRVSIQPDTLHKIAMQYPELDTGWLMTGNGEMLKKDSNDVQFYEPENIPSNKRLIPLYDDVGSMGGKLPKGYSANMESNSPPAEWIDPGDWFKSATAAIRHYGDSMKEYPSGCILALKEVFDKHLIVWGNDYVIETSEYRITKRVQRGEKEGFILACSTNEETYKNGKLMHEPLDVPIDLAKFFLVLGSVVKKGGGTIVFSNQKK